MDSNGEECKKVLVLSLGVGRRNSDVKEKGMPVEPYQTVQYRFENDENTIVSPFVAEALINKEHPDAVLIIGTGKSAWDAFFHMYHNKDIEGWEEVWNDIISKVDKASIKDSDEEIISYKEYLDSIFSNNIVIEGNPIIRTCITKYGLNDDEIKYNYSQILSAMAEVIELDEMQGCDIEVSFDITHSFRSIPYYNLAALNYYSLLSDSRITLKHVYYGNLDVKSENENIAQIVDLADIINIFEMTKGMSEFINTGCADTLVNKIEDDSGFIAQLEQFDKAIKYSRRNEIQNALRVLMNDVGLPAVKDAQFDAKNTIKELLKKEFGDLEGESIASFQLHLAKWCLSIGQVGLSATIAKESLRSFLVRKYEPNQAKYERDDNRKRAEQVFLNVIKQSDEPILIKYDEIERKARSIRNAYAHNLSSDVSDSEEDASIHYNDWQDTIKNYIKCINDIMKLKEDAFAQQKGVGVNQDDKVVILISEKLKNNAFECEWFIKYKEKNRNKFDDVLVIHGINYNLEDRSKHVTKKNQIKRICRAIAFFIKENIQELGCNIQKISFSDRIPGEVIDNSIALLRLFIEGNMGFCKYNVNKEGNIEEKPVESSIIWNISIEYEMDDEKREESNKLVDKIIAERV